jgi:anti-sigma B factor antagonist
LASRKRGRYVWLMIRPVPFEIQGETVRGVERLTVIGELDIATVPELRARAHAVIAQSTQNLTIDLGQVEFIDSSGLSLLIELNRRAETEGWTLSLTRPPERAFLVFSITGADDQLPFIDGERSD